MMMDSRETISTLLPLVMAIPFVAINFHITARASWNIGYDNANAAN